MTKRLFILFFGGLVILDLFVLSVSWPVRWLTKPLIMLSLIAYFYGRTSACTKDLSRGLFLLALVLALTGDILLLNDGFFKWGLISFLGMQLVYSACFLSDRNFFGVREWIAGVIIAFVSLACILFLWPHAGAYQIPVAVYALCIGMMAFLSYTRDFRYPGYRMVFYGALLFMLSDTLLSVNQFVEGVVVHGSLVMGTYALAQYLIVTGWISFICKD